MLEMLRTQLVENGGHDVVGIFRLAPEKHDCDVVKSQINAGTFESCDNVNVIATLIKVVKLESIILLD